MAINWLYMSYLNAKGLFLGGNARILDIGCQHLLDIQIDDGRTFLRSNGCALPDDVCDSALSTFEERSRGGGWGVYAAEFLKLTTLSYEAYDIFSGPSTRILDLNTAPVPDEHRNFFDIVLNFGTTEHIFNQYNAFKVIHEATKPGGHIFHQVPSIGFVNHGYWVYSPRTFIELGHSNKYKVKGIWATGPRVDPSFKTLAGDLTWNEALLNNEPRAWGEIPTYSGGLNILFEKTSDAPFRLPLDATTTALETDPGVAGEYVTV